MNEIHISTLNIYSLIFFFYPFVFYTKSKHTSVLCNVTFIDLFIYLFLGLRLVSTDLYGALGEDKSAGRHQIR